MVGQIKPKVGHFFLKHTIFYLSFQICHNVQNKGDALSAFDGLYDLDEQGIIREDCRALVGMVIIGQLLF